MDDRKRQLFSNALVLFIGKAFVQVSSFVVLILYTRYLTPFEYGIFDLLNTYIGLISQIVSLRIDLGIFRYILDERDNYDRIKKIITSMFFSEVVLCLLFAVALLLIRHVHNNSYYAYIFITVFSSVILSSSMQTVRGLGDNKSFTLCSILTSIVTLLLSCYFVVVLKMKVDGILLAMAIGQMTGCIYLLLSQKICKYLSVKGIDFHLIIDIIKYSAPLMMASIAWWIMSVSDRTIITKVLNSSYNGLYAVSSKIASVVIIAYDVMNMAWTESISLHIDDQDSGVYISKTLNEMIELFSALSICVIVISPILFLHFVDREYINAYKYVPILVLGALFSVACGMFSVTFIAKKDTKQSFKTAAIGAILNLIINLLLIKRIGLYAAAMSTLITYIVLAIYRYNTVNKYVKICIDKILVMRLIIIFSVIIFAYYALPMGIWYIITPVVIIGTLIFHIKSIKLLIGELLRTKN